MKKQTFFWETAVYGIAFQSAMHLYNISKAWPPEEQDALSTPMRYAARAVCANIARAWAQRPHTANFVAGLHIAAASVAETQSWLQFAAECGYLLPKDYEQMQINYDDVDRLLTTMILDIETKE
jgi:four helix bundle protein